MMLLDDDDREFIDSLLFCIRYAMQERNYNTLLYIHRVSKKWQMETNLDNAFHTIIASLITLKRIE